MSERSEATYAPTGITSFDAICGGGLPSSSVAVVLGGPGSGKTVFATQSLCHGADIGEPGIFVGFEERTARIRAHMERFSWPDPGEAVTWIDGGIDGAVERGGDFDLQGLLSIIMAAAERTGARRVVLDGLDMLFALLDSPGAIRREVFRIRRWAVDSGLTVLMTAKTRTDTNTPVPEHGFLEYLGDCVILLRHTLTGSSAIRTMQVTKCRGVDHSANAITFVIGRKGIAGVSATDTDLDHQVSSDRLSTGVGPLDQMLGGGVFRGTSVVVSGAPGTAKTTLCSSFADAMCARGERVLMVAFDESGDQIVRNVTSVGLELEPHIEAGLLQIRAIRAGARDAATHVRHIEEALDAHEIDHLVVDPLSALAPVDGSDGATSAAHHLLDVVKSRGITMWCTTLLGGFRPAEGTSLIRLSTLADTWLHLTYLSNAGERNRTLSIVKSRGMSHSNQVRELVLSDEGISLREVYTAGGEVLVGTLRWEAEAAAAREREERQRQSEREALEMERRLSEIDHRRELLGKEHDQLERDLHRHLERRDAAMAADTTRAEGLRRRRTQGEVDGG